MKKLKKTTGKPVGVCERSLAAAAQQVRGSAVNSN